MLNCTQKQIVDGALPSFSKGYCWAEVPQMMEGSVEVERLGPRERMHQRTVKQKVEWPDSCFVRRVAFSGCSKSRDKQKVASQLWQRGSGLHTRWTVDDCEHVCAVASGVRGYEGLTSLEPRHGPLVNSSDQCLCAWV